MILTESSMVKEIKNFQFKLLLGQLVFPKDLKQTILTDHTGVRRIKQEFSHEN